MIYSGKKFGIRTWQKGDESYLALHANNFNIWKNVRDVFPHPYTYDDAIYWIDFNLKMDKPLNFALVIDDEPIGCIGFVLGQDIHKKSIELGYWLSEEYWGQGIASEAVKAMVDYAFAHFQVNRIWASVFSGNEASERVLLKNGFLHEATLKQSIFKNNVYIDELIFSMLR